MLNSFPLHPVQDVIMAPHGQLEVLVTPVGVPPKVSIVCHPHPLQGGSMTNKVVTTLTKACQNQGYGTIRFNYRGVGQSTGTYGHYLGEIEDLLTVIGWLDQVLPGVPISLLGFSFGAYVSANVAHQLVTTIKWLISVAPAVHHASYDELTNIQCPWFVIHGSKDEVVSLQAVTDFAARNLCVQNIQVLPEASHFFHGQLLSLRHIVEAWIRTV